MATKPQTHSTSKAPSKRRSSTARGYGRAWQRFRERHAQMVPPMCEAVLPSGARCGFAGRSEEMQLDHIEAVRGPDDPRFFDRKAVGWLCRACHGRKTAQEDGGFGRK